MKFQIGDKIQQFTILEIIKQSTNIRPLIKVQCNCGIIKNIKIKQLYGRKYQTISCGCSKIAASKKFRKQFGESARNRLLRRYKNDAKRRNLEFLLDLDVFTKLTQQNCHYCGLQPNSKCGEKNDYGFYIYNGLDRKNNSEGYTIKNSVTCCKQCNRAKMDLNYEDFLLWAQRLTKFLSHRGN